MPKALPLEGRALTESTVRNMLTAIEAPLYDIGVLSERGMLPGLNGMLAAVVNDKLSLLKHRNAPGSHIYIRIGSVVAPQRHTVSECVLHVKNRSQEVEASFAFATVLGHLDDSRPLRLRRRIRTDIQPGSVAKFE